LGLIELMAVAAIVEDDYSWLRCTIPAASGDLAEAARSLAERILRLRCGAATQTVDAWLRAVSGEQEPTMGETAALTAFVRSGFGSPAVPLTADHLEGMTAEYLWYFATIDHAALNGISIARILEPGSSPSSSGGDGLVITRDGDEFPFFLWEIKKNTGRTHVSASVKVAYDQLDANGLEYIARYVGPASIEAAGQPELLGAIATMVDDWESASSRAGAGVAVATSFDKTPQRCFSTFPEHFPLLKPRLKGAVFGIGDFSSFALAVRDTLWIGL